MKKTALFFLTITFCFYAAAQTYNDSLQAYRKTYVNEHGVVKGEDKKSLRFFAPDARYRIMARLEKKDDMPWFPMATSGKIKKNYRVYGVLHFSINDTAVQLPVYQSQDLMQTDKYRDYLFLPFTDATTGIETYDAGRYIDLRTDDIKGDKAVIDFNKAYNPYCAYVSGIYSCPVPPGENRLAVSIRAGEKQYAKH